MSKCTRSIGLLVALLALASPAQAGLKLYQGALSFEGYGNSRVDGHTLASMTTAASTWTRNTFLAEPLNAFCNYKNNTMYLTGTPPMQMTGTMYISTAYAPPKSSLVMDCNPLGLDCNAATPPPTCVGQPITGTVALQTKTMPFVTAMGANACVGSCNLSSAAIIMPGANPAVIYGGYTGPLGVGGMGSGSFDYGYPVIYSVTYLTLGTGPGTFFPGGGPGNLVVAPGPPQFGGLAQTKVGAKQFGGTMRLLGKPGHSVQFYYNGGVGFINTSLKFLFNAVGASYRAKTDCPYPPPAGTPMGPTPHNPCPDVTTDFFIRTQIVDGMRVPLLTTMGAGTMYVTSDTFVYKSAVPWTTGIAYVTAPGGFDTVLQRTGFDNRTVNGEGTIQLVTPQLTNWIGQTFTSNTAGIAILNLKFVPEPSGALMLGSGILFLIVLDRLRNRRARR